MESFCGRSFGPISKGWVTHCFDELLVFGVCYVLFFLLGAWHLVNLLSIPVKRSFPHSTVHSVKVALIGWLAFLPTVILTLRFFNGVQADIEWVSRPLCTLAWMLSMLLLHMETARDMPHSWVLRGFWIGMALASSLNLPAVVLHSQVVGYGLFFYMSLLQWVLTVGAGVMGARRWPRPSELSHALEQEMLEGPLREGPNAQALSTEWRRSLASLMSVFLPERPLIIVAGCAQLVSAPAATLAIAVIGKAFTGFFFVVGEMEAKAEFREYCFVLVLLFGIASTADAISYISVHRAGEALSARLRRRVLTGASRLPAVFFARGSQTKVALAFDMQTATVQRALTERGAQILDCSLTAFSAIFLLFWISWKSTIVSLAVGSFCALILIVGQYRREQEALSVATAENGANSLAALAVGRSAGVKALGAEEVWAAMFSGKADVPGSSGVVSSLIRAGVTLCLQLCITVCMYVCAVLVANKQLEPGMFVAFLFLSIQFVSSVGQIISSVPGFSEAFSAYRGICDVISTQPSDAELTTGKTPDSCTGVLDVVEVYTDSELQPSLRGLSFSLGQGQRVAICGARQGGIEALIQSILRVSSLSSGVIKFDGTHIQDLDSQWLRKNISLVAYGSPVFSATIAANIAFSRDTATQAQVERACSLVGAHEWIQALPDGYNTWVGEEGVPLSLFQRTQVSVARALVCESSTIIFDGTFDSLAVDEARAIAHSLDRAGGRACLIITKDVPLPLPVDNIVMLEEGVAIQTGTHAELLARPGEYRDRALKNGNSDGSKVDSESAVPSSELVSRLEDAVMSLGGDIGGDMLDLVNEIKEAVDLEG